MKLLANGIVEVRPVITRPACYLDGRDQDCRRCSLRASGACRSTMGMCTAPYPGHKNGCPNYGGRDNCPPGMPVFDELFDVDRPVYCLYSQFDMAGQIDEMRRRHPGWSDRQLRCCLYWQNGARKAHREYARGVWRSMNAEGICLTDSPEAMGVDVTKTLAREGIRLEWPCAVHTYKISFAGTARREALDAGEIRGRKLKLGEDGYLTVLKEQAAR